MRIFRQALHPASARTAGAIVAVAARRRAWPRWRRSAPAAQAASQAARPGAQGRGGRRRPNRGDGACAVHEQPVPVRIAVRAHRQPGRRRCSRAPPVGCGGERRPGSDRAAVERGRHPDPLGHERRHGLRQLLEHRLQAADQRPEPQRGRQAHAAVARRHRQVPQAASPSTGRSRALSPTTSPANRRTRSRSRPSTRPGCSGRCSSPGTPTRACRSRSASTRRASRARCSGWPSPTSPTVPSSAGDVAISPPANAKIGRPRLRAQQERREATSRRAQAVTGLAAVQAQLPFTVSAPDTLVGLAAQGRPAGRRLGEGCARPLRPGSRRRRRRRAAGAAAATASFSQLPHGVDRIGDRPRAGDRSSGRSSPSTRRRQLPRRRLDARLRRRDGGRRAGMSAVADAARRARPASSATASSSPSTTST